MQISVAASCTIIAWFVAEFTLGQSLVVNVAAVTAVAYIVFGSRPSFGKYDWRVILYAFGLPAVTGTIPAVLGYMGAVGAWWVVTTVELLSVEYNVKLLYRH